MAEIVEIQTIDDMKQLKQWVFWSEETGKTPRNPHTGGNAACNNPETWATWQDAWAGCMKYRGDGVGFVFVEGGSLFGVDLDDVIDNEELCREFVDSLGSYNEYSKSGTGLHIICRGTLPTGANRRGSVEMYCKGRYFIFTGSVYDARYMRIVDCTEKIKPLFDKYLSNHKKQRTPAYIAPVGYCRVSLDDEKIIDRAKNSKNGMLFSLLWGGSWQYAYKSQSEADLALCNILAFWAGGNAETVDRLFRQSGMMRDKWDELHGGQTYGQMTISKSLTTK